MLDHRVDETALDGQKTISARIALVLIAAAIAALKLGVSQTVMWFVLVSAAEYWFWRASWSLTHSAVPFKSKRIGFLAAALGLTVSWTVLPVMFWRVGTLELAIVALLVLLSQLIHAQTFAFRSPLALAINLIVPAATLMILPWTSGPISGDELLTVSAASALTIAYIAAAARANIRTAASLRRVQDELEHFAYFDALTSLGNRRLFTQHLRALIDLSTRRKSRFALLLLDLDEFKCVNDTLGHDAGDALLVAVGARLREIVGEVAQVARLGGDEFGLLLPDVHDRSVLDALCTRINASLQGGIEFNGAQIVSTSSVGIALFPTDGDQHDLLYKSADLALYSAKHGGRSTWRYSNQLVPDCNDMTTA